MKKAYLDNASTTALRPEVIHEIAHTLAEYGNASSTHSFGRSAKVLLETARKTIARYLNAESREIIFTSGGTEADNMVLRGAIPALGIKRIISSKTEHHAVLNTVDRLAAENLAEVVYVPLLPGGLPDLEQLELLLQQDIPTLVSLMYVNNETGVVLDLEKAGNLCHKYGAYFHTDTVQAIGKTELDFKNLPVDFAAASAHKFHGPKGVGFVYVRKNLVLHAISFGGEQEKGIRPGTEPVHQVAGMAKALELSYSHLTEERAHITDLKNYLISRLDASFPGYKINGSEAGNLFYNIINIQLPFSEDKTSMILFNLDMQGIAVSRGSACQSGSIRPSHVLKEILPESEINKPSLRISFSHNNTKEDIDLLIAALHEV
ncbi:cysteine desulfurase family protein [Flavobacterium sp. RNTU_13]|uniref:cysteine desulfurase family protein n=1 Tax=Flavobacterium sp. RNTU_13 TaxID=3375145 RepID=UPI0039873A34